MLKINISSRLLSVVVYVFEQFRSLNLGVGGENHLIDKYIILVMYGVLIYKRVL
jgi:hypothetical protein